jgi:starch-binding outer membrane protein, SusD/RagB family
MFSTYVASAMLSRVYLQQGEFELAAEEANRVIESGLFALAATPLQAFNKNSIIDEYVFALKQTPTSNAGQSNYGIATFYASLNGTGRGDIIMLDQHLAKYEPGDLRSGIDSLFKPNGDRNWEATIGDVKKMFYLGVGANSDYVNTAKWGDANLNIPVVRLAEMYLTRAEGNFESGAAQVGPNSPQDDINVIRERAGLTDLGTVTQVDIHRERYLELCWEGFTLHDLRRWKENIASLSYDAPNLLLPIPQREMDVNDLLDQNDGY